MSSIIRSLVSRRTVGEVKEVAVDSGVPALIGLAQGYFGARGALDIKGVPMDLVAGVAGTAAASLAPIKESERKMVHEKSTLLVALGASRMGIRLANKGGAGHHGEYDSAMSGFGEDPLVAAAANL